MLGFAWNLIKFLWSPVLLDGLRSIAGNGIAPIMWCQFGRIALAIKAVGVRFGDHLEAEQGLAFVHKRTTSINGEQRDVLSHDHAAGGVGEYRADVHVAGVVMLEHLFCVGCGFSYIAAHLTALAFNHGAVMHLVVFRQFALCQACVNAPDDLLDVLL